MTWVTSPEATDAQRRDEHSGHLLPRHGGDGVVQAIQGAGLHLTQYMSINRPTLQFVLLKLLRGEQRRPAQYRDRPITQSLTSAVRGSRPWTPGRSTSGATGSGRTGHSDVEC